MLSPRGDGDVHLPALVILSRCGRVERSVREESAREDRSVREGCSGVEREGCSGVEREGWNRRGVAGPISVCYNIK